MHRHGLALTFILFSIVTIGVWGIRLDYEGQMYASFVIMAIALVIYYWPIKPRPVEEKKVVTYDEGVSLMGGTIILGIIGLGLGLRGILFSVAGERQLVYVFSWPALVAFIFYLRLLIVWLGTWFTHGADAWSWSHRQSVRKWIAGNGLMLSFVSQFWWEQGKAVVLAIATTSLVCAGAAGIAWFRHQSKKE